MKTGHEGDFLPTGPLTGEEQQALRRMLRDYNQSRWLGRLLLKWAGYVGGTIAFLLALKDQIITFLAPLFRSGG